MVLKASKQKGITYGYCDVNTGQRIYPVPPVSEMTDILPVQVPPPPGPRNIPQEPDVYDGALLNLTCYPPLGQATTINRDQHSVKFVVCIETSSKKVSLDYEPEVVIWHNHNSEHEWSELPLHRKDSGILLVNRLETSNVELWYEGELSGFPKHAHAVSFTIKARVAKHGEFTWIKDATGLGDGLLLYQSQDFQKHSEHDFSQFFHGTSNKIKIETEHAETPETLLYSLTASTSAAEGKDSGYSQFMLGRPNHMVQWFAEVRLWAPWLAPRQGTGSFKVDKEALLLSFLRSDGMHVVVLAISGVKDVLTHFASNSLGDVIIKARNECPHEEDSQVLVAVAGTFETANAAVFYHARKLAAAIQSTEIEEEMQAVRKQDADAQWMEEWYDGFTYCTWNALGQDLTAQKIYDALDDLAQEDIKITNLIIDDNWQSLSGEQGVDSQMDRGWMEFEANKKGFPDGLKKTTATIRTNHPNIKHIAVWHALLGYWGGISPDGTIAKTYKTIEVPKKEGSFHVVAAEDARRMYDDFYRFLSANGVDSVKTDAQFMIDEIKNAPDRKAIITEYQDAWTIAHLRHLSSRAISCMSQTPQIIFHSQLPANKPRVLVRNSDDFFPDIDASHPWHVFANAHNSIITQHLNALPDWDMFQTSHKWSAVHAAARCVSGGPIYFTDYPGHHNIDLIRRITAQTTRGTTIILRPHIVGKSTNPYNEYNSQAMLKVGTFCGYAEKGTGILGLFNVSQRTIREFVKLSDIPGTEHGQYLIHSYVSGELSKPMSQDADKSFIGVKLRTIGWDILTAYPLQSFSTASGSIQAALLGLLTKMTGAAAITGSNMYIESNGRLRIWASFKALGTVGVYISTLPEDFQGQGVMVLMFGKPIHLDCIKVNKLSSKLLEIDIEKAWKDNRETPGWSNEVSIEVFVQL